MPPPPRRPSRPHDQIVAQVKAIRSAREHRPTLEALAAVLDGLNAWDAVEQMRRTRYSRLLSGGPKVCEAFPPLGEQGVYAVGVVMWHRAPGLLGYRVLSVRGVWLADAGAGAQLTTGEKTLPFALPFFDAEPYHKLIPRDYAIYYRDDGLPPTNERAVSRPYVAEDRLLLREWVAARLKA